jgi:hypothetical protein
MHHNGSFEFVANSSVGRDTLSREIAVVQDNQDSSTINNTDSRNNNESSEINRDLEVSEPVKASNLVEMTLKHGMESGFASPTDLDGVEEENTTNRTFMDVEPQASVLNQYCTDLLYSGRSQMEVTNDI